MTLELNILITILTAITLGVLSWMAWKVQELTADMATIKATLKFGESKFGNNDRDLVELRARVTTCEVALAELKISLRRSRPPAG